MRPTRTFQRQFRWLIGIGICAASLAACNSSDDHLVIDPPEPPRAPTTSFPGPGASDQPTAVTLTWSGGSTQNVYWNLYFDATLTLKSDAPTLIAEGLTEPMYELANLEFGTRYTWYVEVVGEFGFSDSPRWHFWTVENLGPTFPTSPLPFHGSQRQVLDPLLSWQSFDPDGGPVEFDLYFGIDPIPPLFVSGHTDNFLSIGPLSYGTLYHWRVVARDEHGKESPSSAWRFTTIPNEAPNPPIDPFPPNGDSSQDIAGLVLRWTCTDPEDDPLLYDVYFGTNNPPPRVATSHSEPSFQPQGLTPATTYYWQVVAKDGINQTTSPVWRFSTTVGEWELLATPIGTNLNGVWTLFAGRFVMVGDNGQVWYYNSGVWSFLPTGLTSDFNDVWSAGPADIFVVGDGGVILRHDGTNATVQTTGTTVELRAIWGTTAFDVWAVGGDNGQATVLHFDGTVWTDVAIPDAPILRDVWGVSGHVYIVGNKELLMHYDGSVWQTFGGWSFSTTNYHGVSAANPTAVFICASNGQFFKYDGRFPSLLDNSARRMNAIWGTAPSNQYAVGIAGRIYRKGQTADWFQMDTPTLQTLNSIDGFSNDFIIAVGINGTALKIGP